MQEIEAQFFQQYQHIDAKNVPMVFILGSPRTGSTLIYQLMIDFFDVFYFTNLANNHFAEHPILAIPLETSLQQPTQNRYESEYGKTKGLLGASEASHIFKHWFGGEHPAETHSRTVLPDKMSHFMATIASIYGLRNNPVLVKNAWNCFRIQFLAETFPNAHFIWIRRDIGLSALSDLESRYRQGDPSTVWNSATTANYREIQQHPYWEQVVEQQYEYNRVIGQDLKAYAKDRFLTMWYEELCEHTADTLIKLSNFMGNPKLNIKQQNKPIPNLTESNKKSDLSDDYGRIQQYIKEQSTRLVSYQYER